MAEAKQLLDVLPKKHPLSHFHHASRWKHPIQVLELTDTGLPDSKVFVIASSAPPFPSSFSPISPPSSNMASAKLIQQGPFSHIINGKAYDQKDAKTLDVINPATEEKIASVPIATREVLDEAVEHAQKAFESWSKTTWEERAKAIKAVGEEYKTLIGDLAELLVLEQGKATPFAQGEVAIVNEWFDRMPNMEIKERVVWENDETKAIEQYVPLGVTAGIVPWNFPGPNYESMWPFSPTKAPDNVS
ncbi:hypothetical protein AC578_939 [Pseudocercospora eumusae]|uniref:Aldehyde dehydrogenase domain-containing protein n=1 Tax=Pseudocercospora eumusae TaxID=321146 RepID=A0A139GV86_9PEZI|nr:hypothetical protein AC578_939 [Pseudocercospora eumusae]